MGVGATAFFAGADFADFAGVVERRDVADLLPAAAFVDFAGFLVDAAFAAVFVVVERAGFFAAAVLLGFLAVAARAGFAEADFVVRTAFAFVAAAFDDFTPVVFVDFVGARLVGFFAAALFARVAALAALGRAVFAAGALV